jgi:hypothetical protein
MFAHHIRNAWMLVPTDHAERLPILTNVPRELAFQPRDDKPFRLTSIRRDGAKPRHKLLAPDNIQNGGSKMRITLIIGAALAVSACGSNGGNTTASDANLATSGNMAMDPMMNGTGNMAMDPMMNGGNMAMDPMMNGTANTLDPATQNMIKQDMNTNSPDTNLANGM